MPEASKLLVVCGEPSGDLYAAELVRELRALDPCVDVFGLGGDHLAGQGAKLVAHVRDLAVVGLLEVVSHLADFRRTFQALLARVDAESPSAAVLIDYPDFNLRLAKELRKRGVPVLYYVSPQLWAWRKGRIRAIQKTVSQMIVIFPFEEALYREAGVPVAFVGHPLVDLVRPLTNAAAFLSAHGVSPERPIVALLPGSRPKEVSHNLPRLAEAVDLLRSRRPDLQFLLAAAANLDPELFAPALENRPIALVSGQTHASLAVSQLALVASGTATVETALLGVPMVVVYRLSPITYAIGRPFVRVHHFAMVNLIAERRLVPELIQDDFTAERVAAEALHLLDHPERAEEMRAGLREVRRRLGEPGASARAARIVHDYLRKSRGDRGT